MAGINDDDIQQLRERVNLVDIIGKQIPLKKSGRTFRGLCPFHNEKTPSFHVDAAKQLYHCFGCGAGGDVFTFLMKHDGLDFPEAVETLARKTGFKLTAQNTARSGAKSRLLKVCEQATIFYQEQLMSDAGAHARAYLKKRNLTPLIERFRLGLSPDWSSLINYLKNQPLDEADILKAGIAGRSQRATLYDRFKSRLIFPITDNQGRPIAFGGRVLDDSSPKYLNSPETPLYHKGSILYGLSEAKNGLIETNTAIVVEGYTDALSLNGAGITNVVATLGTAFTIDHLKLLSRFVERVILLFDGDEAGLTAAERSSEYVDQQHLPGHEVMRGLVDSMETELLVTILPENMDPADFISSNSVEKFKELIENAKPLITFLIDRIVHKHIAKKSGSLIAASEAARMIGTLRSPVAQEEYMRYLADKLGLPYDVTTKEIFRVKDGSPNDISKEKTSAASAEREFIKLILKLPEKALALDDVGIEKWGDESLRGLGAVLRTLSKQKSSSVADILHKLEPEQQSLVSELTLEQLPDGDCEEYFSQIFLKLKELSLERQIDILRKQLDAAQTRNKKSDDIFERLMVLEHKRRDIKDRALNGGH